MNDKVIKHVLGNRRINPMKDTDKDGVADILDCNPTNPNEQGWIHDKAKDLKEKYNEYREVRRKEKEEERERKFITKTKADEARKDEREKQAIETARYSERQKGIAQRKRISSSGGQSGFNQLANVLLGSPKEQVQPIRYRTTKKKGKKKGKRRSKGRRTYVKTRPLKQRSIMDGLNEIIRWGN